MSDHYILLAVQKQVEGLVAERDALRERVAELEAAQRGLWRQTGVEDGTLLVYVAVHAVRWQREWGEPACGFIPVDAQA